MIRNFTIPTGALLVTADIESMYTNISHTEGLMAIKKCLECNPDYSQTRPPTKFLLHLLCIILTKNDFLFDGEFYLQICGTAMGKTYTPSYANIFMAEWERHIFWKLQLKPLIYKRYLDDIFMVWTHGIETFQEFITTVNTNNPCITLTAEHSPTKINFLNLTLFIDPRKPTSIQTRIYHKPTDTMQLLHRQSFHPPATFSGLIKSKIIWFH